MSHILDEDVFASPEQPLELAGAGQRFGNLLIDGIVVGVVAWTIEFAVPSIKLGILGDFVPTFLYYFFFELYNNGKTPGKMLTGTCALQITGEPLNAERAALRSIIRVVPFDALSFLFYEGRTGWHDTWTKTVVVIDR